MIRDLMQVQVLWFFCFRENLHLGKEILQQTKVAVCFKPGWG
jgi:hypothetical protein